MANEEQLSILKQGVDVWNEWREHKPNREIDLTDAILGGTDLKGINLSGTDIVPVDLRYADLSGADLSGADLSGVNLRGADLNGADLRHADLREGFLVGVDFSGAELSSSNLYLARLENAILSNAGLSGADLRRADLSNANMSGADLSGAILSTANLRGCNLSQATLGLTIFGTSDLSSLLGLDDIKHWAPSIVSTDAFPLSKGKIPEVFLRGCGLSDADIEYSKLSNPELSNEEINKSLYKIYDLRATQALQISPLFISYSHGDTVFVDKVGDQLTQKGIRYWRDIHDMKAGRIEKQIDRAIRQNPTVLLVLSEHSLRSDWVEHEVRMGRELEKELSRDVLCPVALDDSWKSSRWPKRVMEQIMEYNILDFSAWKDDSKFGDMLRKLIDGLELFYKG